MSFRGRLRLFFALIVIVPMVALGAVLFVLTARSETGKVDAGIASAARAVTGIYREEMERAVPALRRIARDPELQRALAAGRTRAAAGRLRELRAGAVVAAQLWTRDGRPLVRVGSAHGVAPAGSALVVHGSSPVILSVSVTRAADFTERAEALTGHAVVVARGGTVLASTLADRPRPGTFRAGDRLTTLDIAGEDYRGRLVQMDAPAGAPGELAIPTPTASFSEHVATNRLLIALLVGFFVLLALVSAGFVSRALTGQIATFLAAARRLSRGDFRQLVPLHGNDEFAELGREFNDMSVQLEPKMEEVERKRQELAETIRRVGDALATGLDRRGVVALAVRQAVDACEADVGRALPLARGAFAGCEVGRVSGELERA